MSEAAPHVLLAATSYPRDDEDWRGRFIHDQAAALARSGARVALWAPPGKLPAGVVSALSGADAPWLEQLLQRGGIAHLLRHRPVAGAIAGWRLLRRLRRACAASEADVFLVNWLQNALALPDDRRPAIITVLGSDLRLLNLPGMTCSLRRRVQRRPTLLAPNAEWMAPRLRMFFGGEVRVAAIPFGVDAAWFGLQRWLQPQPAANGWLLVSRITAAKLGRLQQWGEGLFGPQRPLHLLGPAQEALTLPAWVSRHGPTHPQALRRQWFPAACGLLSLSSHAEGRPQVLIEAMAAGLPVIASNIAAHADLIRHGETGWLVNDAAALAQALAEAEDEAVARRVGAAAHAYVREHIGDWDDCARRYRVAIDGLMQPMAR